MDPAAYLARIGVAESDDLATLAERHFQAVPFENLSIHLGARVRRRVPRRPGPRPGRRPGYRLERRERSRADFEPTCYWTATHPDSGFTHGPTCTLPTTAGGRVTLAGTRLVRTAPDGTRTEDALSDGEVLATYRDLFGISLDRLPAALHPPASS